MNAASRRPGCKAVQHSDQMCCGRCGLAWDVNDPDPPPCSTETIRAGYIDTKTMRVAFSVKTLFEHVMTADMTMYHYAPAQEQLGLDPWRIVIGLDASTKEPNSFYVDLSPTNTTMVTADDILFLSAKDAAEVKTYDLVYETLKVLSELDKQHVAAAIQELLTCQDNQLADVRKHFKTLFNR